MTTRAEEIAAEGPYRADHENGFSVVRDLSAPEGSKIMMMMPEPMKWFADRMNEAHANGYKHGQQDRWIPVSERSPENMTKVIAFSRFPDGDWYQNVVTYHEKHGFLNLQKSFVTHWMTLPPNPEQP